MKKNLFKSPFGQNDEIGPVSNEAFHIIDTNPTQPTEGWLGKQTAKKGVKKNHNKTAASSERSEKENLATMDEINSRLDNVDCNCEDLEQGSEFIDADANMRAHK